MEQWGRVLVVGATILAALVPCGVSASELTRELAVDGNTANRVLSQPLTLTHGTRTWAVPASTLRTWVRTRTDGDTTFLRLNPGRIYAYLNQMVSPVVNDAGENARFVFRNGVAELKASGRPGSIVDGVKTSLDIRRALTAGKSTAAVSRKSYAPRVQSLADFKKLGITERIARGQSNFRGSPANRAHNIAIGRSRYQGILVAPGEEFSFNKYLGPVTAETGYRPELVILENVTTPQYGGGLCQVSTTAFRAAVRAGFDVTARRQHAYPVRYYGTPGFDATIYPPSPDLRFTNNTGKWVLIQTSIEGTKLIFDIYGKPTGRTVTIDGPHITEKRPDGSLRALLRQTVKDKAGNVIHSELFKSEYKSPDLFPRVRQENGEI